MPESDAFDFEHAVPTGRLRWHEYWAEVELDPFFKPNKTMQRFKSLQQEYSIQISEGQSLKEIRREWRDIPTEIEK